VLQVEVLYSSLKGLFPTGYKTFRGETKRGGNWIATKGSNGRRSTI